MQLLELVGEPGSGEGANYNAHVECQFLGSGDNYGENEASWIAAEFWSADAVGVCGNSWIRLAGPGTKETLFSVAMDGSSVAVRRADGGDLPDCMRRRQRWYGWWRRRRWNWSDADGDGDWNFRNNRGVDLCCADCNLARSVVLRTEEGWRE